MLRRLYVDNYRCLSNFELVFYQTTLLFGVNGGGKSSVCDLLQGVHSLIVDKLEVVRVFSSETYTSWTERPQQIVELEVESTYGLFVYKLVVSFDDKNRKQRIELESLTLDGMPLFEFSMGEVSLYQDDHISGPKYSFDWTASALASVAPRDDNQKLTWFKKWIEGLVVLSLEPKRMTSETKQEANNLEQDASNFASWYRFFSQEHQDKIFFLTEQLRDVLPGFYAFKLEQAGKHRILKVGFRDQKKGDPVYFDFDRLSDGQRVIIVLYSLLHGLRSLGLTLFIDEPENYVALSEIQPWLMELRDVCSDHEAQVVLISHHPELIDYLGPDCGMRIEREPLGPARARAVSETMDEDTRQGKGLKLSELEARGW